MLNQIKAKIIADSVNSYSGTRLVTMELKFHRFILPEFNTHRMLSSSASSSRAIKTATLIEQVMTNPMIPVHWGVNKPGMQANEELSKTQINKAIDEWKKYGVVAAQIATKFFKELNVHKQITNRLLEPFLPIKVVVTSTEWDNFYKLRNHHAAQPEIQVLAKQMYKAMQDSAPTILQENQWHLPYLTSTEKMHMSDTLACKVSTARCARVSYLNHDKSNPVIADDLDLFDMLATRPYHNEKRSLSFDEDEPSHCSPLEHQATPINTTNITKYTGSTEITHASYPEGLFIGTPVLWSGNLRNWIQHRHANQ